MKKIIALMLCCTMCVAMAGCAKKEEPAPVAEPQEEETTIWGDEAYCIDTEVDKSLADYRLVEIVGIDNGGRSDVMFVVAVPKNADASGTRSAKMFTVYRDTLMKVNPDGESITVDGRDFVYYKCNRGLNKSGKIGAMRELNAHLDLNIREIIGLNWDGVAKLVDAIGGIEATGSDGGDGSKGILKGKEAVAYLRERHEAGQDASTRSDRNGEILLQVFDKVKTLPMAEQIDLYDDLADSFETNMSRTTITEFIAELATIEVETLDGFPYEYDKLWDQWGAYYYYVPQETLKENVVKLHEKLFGQQDYQPSETASKLSDEIEEYEKTMK